MKYLELRVSTVNPTGSSIPILTGAVVHLESGSARFLNRADFLRIFAGTEFVDQIGKEIVGLGAVIRLLNHVCEERRAELVSSSVVMIVGDTATVTQYFYYLSLKPTYHAEPTIEDVDGT